MLFSSHLSCLDISLSNVLVLKSLERVPETGRWRFMDVSPKFEASVSTISFPHPITPSQVTVSFFRTFFLFSPEKSKRKTYDMI